MQPDTEHELNRFSYNVRSGEGVTVLELNGELDMYTLPRAQEVINMLLEQNRVNVLMDLIRLEYIDSAGLGFFTATLKCLRERDGELKLIRLNPYIKRVFDLIHLDYFIDVYEDEKAAFLDFKDNISRAILKWKKVTELKPNYADAYFQLGHAFMSKGMYSEAATEFEHALRINSSYAEAHKALGDCLKQAGDDDGALEHFRRAVELRPGYAGALMALGISYNDRTMIDDALMQYEKALKSNPHYADIHNKMGIALRARGDFMAAENAFKQALAINTGFVEAHKNLGDLFMEQQRPREAMRAYREAVKYSSNDAEVENLRSMIRKLRSSVSE